MADGRSSEIIGDVNSEPAEADVDYFDKNCHQELLSDAITNSVLDNTLNDESNTVTIDVSNPIQLAQNSVIVVNGQKCLLQQQQDTGHLFAYPIKEPAKPKKKRGRPKKVQPINQDSGFEKPAQPNEVPQSESIEKGLVETSNEAGEMVKRSTRKRNMSKVLSEYETELVPSECGSDDELVAAEQLHQKKRIRPFGKKRNPTAQHTPPLFNLLPYLKPVKRERGRPKRYGIRKPSDTQALLIPTPGGQTVMMHIPIINVSADKNVAGTTGTSRNNLQQSENPPLLPQLAPTTADLSTIVNPASNTPHLSVSQNPGDATNAASPVTATVIAIPQNSALLARRDLPIKIGLKASENDLGKFKCPKCCFQAYYQQQYQDHIRQHTSDVHRCKCCSYVSLEEKELVQHYKDTHPKCICLVCNHMADQAYIIRRHMYRHSGSGAGATCDTCGKTYKNHYIMRMHIRMVHTPPDVIFECSICSKKFRRKAHLKRHLRTHDPDRPFKCLHCDYKGCERADITKHQLIHEEPQHTCEVCGKTFRHLRNKELHVKRHKGQRDYKCGVCEYFGYTFTDIRKHIERKHTGANTIICEKCGQAFICEQSLEEHRNSRQCEILMLEQVLQEAESVCETTLQTENEFVHNAGDIAHEEASEVTTETPQVNAVCHKVLDDSDNPRVDGSQMLGEIIIEADNADIDFTVQSASATDVLDANDALDPNTAFLSQDVY